jgi:cation:H+ antiporter
LRFQKTAVIDELPEEEVALPVYKIVLFLAIGGLGLWGGSELLIEGASALAKDFGVSDRVIAVTIISVGTSIPELAASIIAIIKREKAISLGNLIGSNVFNILAVLGITSMITPLTVSDERLLTNDIFWMLGISFLLLPLVFSAKKMSLNWKNGVLLLICYVLFVCITI